MAKVLSGGSSEIAFNEFVYKNCKKLCFSILNVAFLDFAEGNEFERKEIEVWLLNSSLAELSLDVAGYHRDRVPYLLKKLKQTPPKRKGRRYRSKT